MRRHTALTTTVVIALLAGGCSPDEYEWTGNETGRGELGQQDSVSKLHGLSFERPGHNSGGGWGGPGLGDSVPVGMHHWHQGAYETTEEIPYDEAWEALQNVKEQLGYDVYLEQKYAHEGDLILELTEPSGQHLSVRLIERWYGDLELTGVRIRYGLFGDIDKSREINTMIRQAHASIEGYSEQEMAERLAAEAEAQQMLDGATPAPTGGGIPAEPIQPQAEPQRTPSAPPAPIAQPDPTGTSNVTGWIVAEPE